MRLPIKRILLIFSAFLAAAIFSVIYFRTGEEPGSYYINETRFIMGTYCSVRTPGGKGAEKKLGKAMERMEHIYDKFNIYSEGSVLYDFNNHSVPVMDTEIVGLIKKSLNISAISGGAFDISVYPLIRLWGFDSREPSLPGREKIRETLSLVGADKLKVRDSKVIKSEKGVKIDMGGIAKGYAVDRASEVLRKEGVTSALIDAGGDIYAMGLKGDRKWRVGIRSPRGGGIKETLELKDMAVATSGDYENSFTEEGDLYHHIIDPRSGYPATGSASVTVIAPSVAEADGWATAFFVMGPERALELVSELDEIEVFIITPELEIFSSEGFNSYLQ